METQKVDFHSDTESEIDRGEVRGNIVWKGNQFPIFEGENIIGREDDCDVTIEHDSVSLKHAVLDYENGIAIMRDLKSKNGTSLESGAGSGNYIKLGPTRRNEKVGNNCKIRFGLVDCKFIIVETEESVVKQSSAEKKDLKYDCETQFINLAAPDSEDEDEEEHVHGNLNKSTSSNSAYDSSYDRPPVGNPFSAASFDRGSSRSTVLEMETQLDQDLNSAEKAQVHSSNTPSSIFSSRLVHGIASGGIDSPAANSGMSTPSMIVQRTTTNTGNSTGSSTKNSTRSATPIVLSTAVRDDTPATAVGDDDCSTEDEGEFDEAAHRHDDKIEIPIPSFHPVGIADEAMSDGSDDGSEMSQDLMRAEDGHDEEDAERSPVEAAAAPVPRRLLEPQEDVPTDDEADEDASVDFKLAQDDVPHLEGMDVEPAVSRAHSLTASTGAPVSSDSPFHNMASADSRLSAPMDIGHDDIIVENGDTNMSRLSATSSRSIIPSRSNSIVLEANTEPQEFFTAPDPPTAPSVFANPSSPTLSSSPTISGSERELAARDLRTSVRSPGAAIRDLLKNSAIPEGLKVFRSQGGLNDSNFSASPAMSSEVSCSLPPDAPSLHFDFGTVVKNGLPTSSTKTATGRNVEHEEVEESVVVKPTKAKAARPRKRIFDEESDAEFDEPLPAPVASKSTSSSNPAPAVQSAVKRARTNPRTSSEVVEAVEPVVDSHVGREIVLVVPTAVASAPSTVKKTPARARKTPSPAPLVEDTPIAEEDVPTTAKKTLVAKKGRSKGLFLSEELPADEVVAPVQKVEEVQAVQKTPAKRGRGKAAVEVVAEESVQASSEETLPQVVETVPTVETTPAPKTAKRGRGKALVEETAAEVLTEPEVPVHTVVEAEQPLKAPGKRGKGKVTISESVSEQIPAAEEPESEPALELASAVTSKGTKRGRGNAALEERAQDEEPSAAKLVEVDVAEPPSSKAQKGRGKQSPTRKEKTVKSEDLDVSEPAEAVVESPAPALKGAKKGIKRGVASLAEENNEIPPADAVDQEVRILFTKVDDAPYLKAIKSLPNASITSDATVATHCVTLPELKRTPKLMVALNCGVKYVVTEQWIKDCVKAKALVEVVKPADAAPAKKSKKNVASTVDDARADAELLKQLQSSPYLVQDADKEKLWGFSMATTLSIPRNPAGAKLFDKMCFFCTKGVCGETAPPADEMATIILSGGGIWLNSLDEWSQYVDTGAHALVVISHASVMKKEINKKVNDAISKGRAHGSGVYSIELVFLACLKQRVEFESHLLK